MTKPYHRESESGVHFERWIDDGFSLIGPIQAHRRWLDQANGTTLPNWRTLIANHDEATTPFNAVQVSVEKTPGYLWRKGWTSHVHVPANEAQCLVYGDFDQTDYSLSVHQGRSDSDAIAMAATQFFNRAHNAMVALEGGELLGEIGETVREIKHLSRDMTTLFRDWRRTIRRARRIKKAGRAVAGIVSDAYLRWKFGWDPLAKDVNTLANGLKDDFEEVVPLKAHGSSVYKYVPDTDLAFNDNNLAPTKKVVQRSEETTVRYKFGVRVKRYGAGGLVETLGLSPRNFLPTVYNLLPWTYMIDYFSNLGSIVSAIAFDDARISFCCQTVRRLAKVEVITGFDPQTPPPGLPNWDDAPGSPIAVPSRVLWTSKSVSRGQGAPLVPQLRLKLPNFATTGGAIQGINIAAVLAGQTWGSSEMSRFRNG